MTYGIVTKRILTFRDDDGSLIAMYPSWSSFTILNLLIEVYRHPIMMHWSWNRPWNQRGFVFESASMGAFTIPPTLDMELDMFCPDIRFFGEDGGVYWISTTSFMKAIFDFMKDKKPKRWDLLKTWIDGITACCAIAGILQDEELVGCTYTPEILDCEERPIGGFLYIRHEMRGLVPVWEALVDAKNALFISMEGLK